MAEQMDNGEQTFLDMNGNPLSGGLVFFYAPNTSNYLPTWQDPAGTILNTQPVVLDQAGRAVIWGIGKYRQIVEDQFGNVQWDRVTSAGVTIAVGEVTGDLSVTGNLLVNGSIQGNSLNVNNETVSGTLNVTNEAVAGLLTAGNINTNLFQASGQATFDGLLQGTQGFFTHLQTGNTLSNDTNTNTLTVNSSANINSLLVDNVTALNGPLEMHSNLDVVSGYSIDIQGGGLQTNTIQTYNTATVQCGSHFTPISNHGADLGLSGLAWDTVVAGNYVTASTDPTSNEISTGFLDKIKSVPVKTAPHVGIAKEDLAGIPEAQHDAGVSYNALVGILWQALKELNAKFDAYVAAHP